MIELRRWHSLFAVCVLITAGFAFPAGVLAQAGSEPLPQWITFTADDGLPGAVTEVSATADGKIRFTGAEWISEFDGTAWETFFLAQESWPSESVSWEEEWCDEEGLILVIGDGWGNTWIVYPATECGVLEYPDFAVDEYRGAVGSFSEEGQWIYREMICDWPDMSELLWDYRGDDLWLWPYACQPWQDFWFTPDGGATTALWGDSVGALWAGTEEGQLWRYDGQEWALVELAVSSTPGRIQSIRRFEETGPLWLFTDVGVIQIEPESGSQQLDSNLPTTMEFELSVNQIWHFGEGGLWATSDAGLAFILPGAAAPQSFEELAREAGLEATDGSARIEDDGSIWGPVADGLAKFDPSSGEWRTFTTGDTDLLHRAKNITLSRTGEVWATTETGVAHYDPAAKRWQHFPAEEQFVDLAAVHQDQAWLVHVDGSVSLLDLGQWVRLVPPAEEEYFTITAVEADVDSRYWIGTNKGLFHFDHSQDAWQNVNLPEPLAERVADLWLDDENGLWVATDGGLGRYETAIDNWTFFGPEQGLPTGPIINVDGRGDHVWVLAGYRTLFEYDQSNDIWTQLPACGGGGYGADAVDVLYIDSQGRPWSVEWGARYGLIICRTEGEPPKAHEYRLYSDEGRGAFQGYALVPDAAGSVILASTVGLMRYDPAVDTFVGFELPGRRRAAISELEFFEYTVAVLDAKHVFWLGRWRYDLARYDPIFSPAPIQLSYDGAADLPDQILAGIRRLLFRGDQALYVADTAVFVYHPAGPAMYLDGLRFADGWVEACDNDLVTLPYTRTNPTVDFHVVAWSSKTAEVRYRYRLLSASDPEPDWRFLNNPDPTEARWMVPLSDLTPGYYRFEIAASDARLNWSIPAACRFRIESAPPRAEVLNVLADGAAAGPPQKVEPEQFLFSDLHRFDFTFLGQDDVITSPHQLDYCATLSTDPDNDCRLDSNTNWRTGALTHTEVLSAGTYTLSLFVRDPDGQLSAADTARLEVPRSMLAERWWQWLLAMVCAGGVAYAGAAAYPWLRSLRRFRYQDLAVVVSSTGAAGSWQVRFSDSQGKTSEPFAVGLGLDALHEPLERLRADQTDERFLQELGASLYGGLFSPAAVDYLQSPYQLGRRPLRLRMQFVDSGADGGLAAFPWELAYAGEQIGFLAQREDTALVRYVEPNKAWIRPERARKVRVLVVLALPEHLDKLDLKAEKERLDRVFGSHPRQVACHYLVGRHAARLLGIPATPGDLDDALAEWLAQGWDVVHFSGHAGPEQLTSGGKGDLALWLEDDEGLAVPLGPKQLAPLLGKLAKQRKSPSLVVLSACRTAEVAGGLVPMFFAGGVGAVIGMQWTVLDDAARAFTERFYTTLFEHGQVDHAVSVGRNSAAQEVTLDRRDWAAPVLTMQMADGRLFDWPRPRLRRRRRE